MIKKFIAGFIEKRTISNLNKEITKIVRGRKILDDGGGNGSFDYSKHEDKEIYNIDIKERDFSLCKNVKFKISKADNLPFRKEFFDCVCYAGVIQYVEDYSKSLSEINRVIKKDGILILATVNRDSLLRRIRLINPLPKRNKGEFNIFSFNQIISILKKNNFKILGVRGVDFIKLTRGLSSNILIIAKRI